MILGIVGSPRKGRLTDQLVTRALEGVKSAGVESEKVYLIDYKIPILHREGHVPRGTEQIMRGGRRPSYRRPSLLCYVWPSSPSTASSITDR